MGFVLEFKKPMVYEETIRSETSSAIASKASTVTAKASSAVTTKASSSIRSTQDIAETQDARTPARPPSKGMPKPPAPERRVCCGP
ncbi:hypothetical protein EW145_g3723 [Phellinidium pouzarii]|uniref:Uncharacterized protein n=1 Tax=Phellinidium pouzarii TaxID=167371 RepID=A0A4S4L6A6_9AGAM|nr:hypothetical protein EW145_g3723 [Phellinidium pouzarii]